jgi:hypothetical protein
MTFLHDWLTAALYHPKLQTFVQCSWLQTPMHARMHATTSIYLSLSSHISLYLSSWAGCAKLHWSVALDRYLLLMMNMETFFSPAFVIYLQNHVLHGFFCEMASELHPGACVFGWSDKMIQIHINCLFGRWPALGCAGILLTTGRRRQGQLHWHWPRGMPALHWNGGKHGQATWQHYHTHTDVVAFWLENLHIYMFLQPMVSSLLSGMLVVISHDWLA